MQIVIPTFPRLTALDAVGPYEVLQRVPGAEVIFAGAERGPVRTDNGMLGIVADVGLDEVPSPDVVLVPGGFGTRALLSGGPVVDWVRSAHETSTWTTSVCTGALVLAAAGVLDGVDAVTHWAAMDTLGELGAVPTPGRYHVRGKVITAAGVSAGIDMALWLATQLADEETAKVIQLYLEYEPEPPFHEGSLTTASARTIEAAREFGARARQQSDASPT
ncbi:MAG: DJ-1/PfpI family protein [Acidimicrobiales bacterium]